MQEITLKLTVDETNLILEGLGSLPFTRVYALIAKIQTEATQQLNRNTGKQSPLINKRSKEPTKTDA